MPIQTLKSGSARRVAWVADESGRYRGKDFYETELNIGEQAKFEVLFERIATTGKIHNNQKFVHEGNKIYAFKIFKKRLACFMDERKVLITNGYTKKDTKRGSRGDAAIKTAERIRSHYQEGN